MNEEEMNHLMESLPLALHPLDRDIKLSLVTHNYRTLANFPRSAEANDEWNDLKEDCGYDNATRNIVRNALFPSQFGCAETPDALVNKDSSKVTFEAMDVYIFNWNTGSRKMIRIRSSYYEFMREVLLAFDNEIESLRPIGSLFCVFDDDYLNEKTRITASNYHAAINSYVSDEDQKIYFVNSLESPQTTPIQLLFKKLNSERSTSTSDVSSLSSNSSRNSLLYRDIIEMDNNTCLFCGLTSDPSTFEAAYLLRKKDVKGMSIVEQHRLFKKCGLQGIDVACNLITLCTRKCHTKFDSNDIGFSPERKWRVRDNIRSSLIRKNGTVTYGDFDGKPIVFNCEIVVPDALYQYREEKYNKKSDDIIKEKKRIKGAKKTAQEDGYSSRPFSS